MTDDLGYYLVGQEKFHNKILAILRAQQLNLQPEDVKWIFNDSSFQAFNWSEEPETSLDEFYKIRAQQIRSEYDYVLLFCSGGADSTNMLYAFLNNGIRVDEIVASAPVSGLRDWHAPDPTNTDVRNTIDETFITQIPFLKKIQVEHPNIKVTLHDYFEDMLNYKQDDWLLKGTDWIHPTMAGRYNLDRYTHLKRIAESGKKIAVVQGIDKPQLIRYKSYMAITFADCVYNNKYDSINHPNTNPVFFYHAPQLPQMIIKQAHVTARFILRPENKNIYNYMPLNYENYTNLVSKEQYWYKPEHSKFVQWFNGGNPGIYERGIVPAIYPAIKKQSFQAQKPDKMLLGNHDYWFYKHHQGTEVYQMMSSDLQNLQKTIDKRFWTFNAEGQATGLRVWRRYYNLGNIDKFLPITTINYELDKITNISTDIIL